MSILSLTLSKEVLLAVSIGCTIEYIINKCFWHINCIIRGILKFPEFSDEFLFNKSVMSMCVTMLHCDQTNLYIHTQVVCKTKTTQHQTLHCQSSTQQIPSLLQSLSLTVILHKNINIWALFYIAVCVVLTHI